MVKAMAPLPLIFLPISIGGSVIFWAILGHFSGVLGGYLVDGEGHGATALDLLAHINRRYRNFLGDFWAFGGCFGGYLFDCEGHGAIAHINRRYVVCFWANFWTFEGRFFGIFVGN